MPFLDRAEAGRKLARALASYKDRNPVVLALPRGGLPVGAEIAAALEGAARHRSRAQDRRALPAGTGDGRGGGRRRTDHGAQRGSHQRGGGERTRIQGRVRARTRRDRAAAAAASSAKDAAPKSPDIPRSSPTTASRRARPPAPPCERSASAVPRSSCSPFPSPRATRSRSCEARSTRWFVSRRRDASAPSAPFTPISARWRTRKSARSSPASPSRRRRKRSGAGQPCRGSTAAVAHVRRPGRHRRGNFGKGRRSRTGGGTFGAAGRAKARTALTDHELRATARGCSSASPSRSGNSPWDRARRAWRRGRCEWRGPPRR